MQKWMWITTLVVLVIIISWPPFLLILSVISGLYFAFFLSHKFGPIPPFWNWGTPPQTCVTIKWWNPKSLMIYLEYRIKHSNHPWIKVLQNEIPLNSTCPIKEINSQFIFEIKDLEPGKEYEYRFINSNLRKILMQKSNFIFKTQPESHIQSEFTSSIETIPLTDNIRWDYKFAVCGDLQLDEPIGPVESFMMWKIKREDPSFILFLGDHVSKYHRFDLWYAFFRIMYPIFPQIPFYPVIGNHCGGDGGQIARSAYLLCPDFKNLSWNYTWSFYNIFFIGVNSLPILQKDWKKVTETESWLKYNLDHLPESADFAIIYMHVPWIGPPYSQTNEISYYEEYLEKNWKPIFDSYQDRIAIVFSGHKHSYVRDNRYMITASIHGVRKYTERRDPDHIVHNGHHYVMVEGSKNHLRVRAKSWNNKILDEIILIRDNSEIRMISNPYN